MKSKLEKYFFKLSTWVIPVLILFITTSQAMAQQNQEQGSVWDSTCDVVGGCAKGAGKFVVNVFDFFFVEPVRLIHDDGVMIYYWATDQNEEGMQWVLNGEAWSDYSKSWQAAALMRDQSQPLSEYVLSNLGTAAYEIPKNMVVGIVMMPWDMQAAWEQGEYEKVGELGANMLSIVVPAAWGLRNVTLTIPRNSIRYVPVAVGENQFALAAISVNEIAIEGFKIPAGSAMGIFISGDGGLPSKDSAAGNNMKQVADKIREYREKQAVGFKPGEQKKLLDELDEMLGQKKEKPAVKDATTPAPKSPQKPTITPGAWTDGGLPFDAEKPTFHWKDIGASGV